MSRFAPSTDAQLGHEDPFCKVMPPPPPRPPGQPTNYDNAELSNPWHGPTPWDEWNGGQSYEAPSSQQVSYQGDVHLRDNYGNDQEGYFPEQHDAMGSHYQNRSSGTSEPQYHRQVDDDSGESAKATPFMRKDPRGTDYELGRKAREITPTSLFHNAHRDGEIEKQSSNGNDDTSMQEQDDGTTYDFQEENPHHAPAGSPVNTVVVTATKQKCQNRDSNESSTLAMTSAFHEKSIPIPTKRFKDIIGHKFVKLRLEELILPLKLPPNIAQSVFKGVRSLPASVLLMGPPGKMLKSKIGSTTHIQMLYLTRNFSFKGTGKTALARAVAGETQAAFLTIGPSDVLSKYVGESEASVKAIFSQATEMARQVESKAAVIFFDEIDALGQSRGTTGSSGGNSGSNMSTLGTDANSRRVLAELLIQLSRLNSDDVNMEDEESKDEHMEDEHRRNEPKSANREGFDSEMRGDRQDEAIQDGDCMSDGKSFQEKQQVRLFVLAATNRRNDCDPALLRRFGIQVEVGLPLAEDRIAFFKQHLKDLDHALTEEGFEKLATATNGFSGSDIESISREAVMAPVREVIAAAAKVKRKYSEEASNQRNGDEACNVIGEAYAKIFLEHHIMHLRPVEFADYADPIKSWVVRRYASVPN
ncbi:MAG: hypothetical protein SGILL_006288 [Bacillariaceae sp.]